MHSAFKSLARVKNNKNDTKFYQSWKYSNQLLISTFLNVLNDAM